MNEEMNNVPSPEEGPVKEAEEKPAFGEERYSFKELDAAPASSGWSIASMVLGIVSILLVAVRIVPIVVGVAAVVFAIVSRKKLGYFNGFSVAGLVTGIFGITMGVGVLLAGIFFPELFASEEGILPAPKSGDL